MATVTAQTIIDGAFLLIQISAPQTADRTAGLIVLNDMLGTWGADGLLVPYMTVENFALIASQQTYTIGSGGDFDTVRPIKIENAYIRDSSNNDYPVEVLMSKKEWNEISLKSTEARPERLYYDPQYPLGKIYFDFTPDAAETLYVDTWKSLTELAATSTSVDLPDMYKRALKYNLAVDLAPIYGRELMPAVISGATESRSVIANINVTQTSEMKIDLGLRVNLL